MMKKTFSILVIAAALLVTLPTTAQIKFGIRGGANLVNMKFNNGTFDKDNRAGFYVGPTVKFTVPIVGLSLDASALYDEKTAEVNGETMKAQSIDIPINVRYGVGQELLQQCQGMDVEVQQCQRQRRRRLHRPQARRGESQLQHRLHQVRRAE